LPLNELADRVQLFLDVTETVTKCDNLNERKPGESTKHHAPQNTRPAGQRKTDKGSDDRRYDPHGS
jgi:hypothetical protein